MKKDFSIILCGIFIVIMAGLLYRLYEYQKINENLNNHIIDISKGENDTLLYTLINTYFNIEDIILFNDSMLQINDSNLQYNTKDVFLFIPELNCLTCLERSLSPFFRGLNKKSRKHIVILTNTDNLRYILIFRRNNFHGEKEIRIYSLKNLDRKFEKIKTPFFFSLTNDYRIINVKPFNKRDSRDNVYFCKYIIENEVR